MPQREKKLWTPAELAAREREVGIEPLEPTPRQRQLERLRQAPCMECGHPDSPFGEHDCEIQRWEFGQERVEALVDREMAARFFSSAGVASFDPANPVPPHPNGNAFSVYTSLPTVVISNGDTIDVTTTLSFT